MNENNVCDRLLSKLPEADKAYLRKEYSIVNTVPDSMPFLDRVVADSRSIGLYHTSGLSTPSQVFMDMLALSHLVYAARGEEDPYIRLANDTIRVSLANLNTEDYVEIARRLFELLDEYSEEFGIELANAA